MIDASASHVRRVVIGLGNTILADDAVGVHVARALAREPLLTDVDVHESCRGGLDLLELLVGYDEAHIIDALVALTEPVGTVRRLAVADLPRALNLASSHEVDLTTAIILGRRLELQLPSRITIWGVFVSDPFTICDEMTPALRAALANCVRCVLDGLTAPVIAGCPAQ